MAAEKGPQPQDTEDSVTRFASPAEVDNRGIAQQFDRRTTTLIDGPNAGQTVEWWVPVVAVESEELALESQQALINRYGGGKTPIVFTVTAAGDTTIHTPDSGKAIRLFWITAVNDPDEATSPLIKVTLTDEIYRVYALAHWEVFEGAVNDPLIINLGGAASVAVTAHIEEFTP